MISRRSFIAQTAFAAGTSMIAVACASALSQGKTELIPVDTNLRSKSAAGVVVEPGPWKYLPPTEAGVRIENVYLKMADGIRLNAFVYLPDETVLNAPRGAVLNTHPYRMAPRDDSLHVRNGLASVFVDVRGTGGSEGYPVDEYSHQEHKDTAAIVEWISKQSWCNGNVGMYGASYSAFNSLQIAYEMKPSALKAIFLMAGTDDRYTDDIHNPGGTMLMVDNSWALGMLVMNTMPGAPDYVLDDKAALDRWETPPWLMGFLRNQVDGAYWRHGSLAPDYDRLEVPTYLVGGYLDIYQNQVMRIMRNSTKAETRGILGPWHHWLDTPGPALDLRAIQTRWFNHWLNDNDTGMMEEPRATFYMPQWRRQTFRFTDDVPGEWRYLDDWPDTAFEPDHKLFFRPTPELPVAESLNTTPGPGFGGSVSDTAGPASALRLEYKPGSGGTDQSFGPTGGEGYYGLDRRNEDPFGLSFDTPPLTEPLEMLGFARAKLFVSSSAPVANWIVRVCDVAPDGTSYLVARGYLNGTHRNSHSNPEPLVPDEIYELNVELMCTGYNFSPGHQIRINISNADFPVLWPSPEHMTTTLYTGGDKASSISLPVLRDVQYRKGSVPVGEPLPDDFSLGQVDEDTPWYELKRNIDAGATTALFNLPLGGKLTCYVKDNDPGNASMNIATTNVEAVDGRTIETYSEGSLRSTPEDFVVDIKITLRENGKDIRTKRWTDRVKRQLI